MFKCNFCGTKTQADAEYVYSLRGGKNLEPHIHDPRVKTGDGDSVILRGIVYLCEDCYIEAIKNKL